MVQKKWKISFARLARRFLSHRSAFSLTAGKRNRCFLLLLTSTPVLWVKLAVAISPGSSMTIWKKRSLVPHGCASHDFNLVSESEIEKLIDAIERSKKDSIYTAGATRSARLSFGSVQVLYQRFGDAVLMITTRSPKMTEDLDYSIGMAIMAEGHRWFPHVAFVDAHNCMCDLSSAVLPATLTATEYQHGAILAMEACSHRGT